MSENDTLMVRFVGVTVGPQPAAGQVGQFDGKGTGPRLPFCRTLRAYKQQNRRPKYFSFRLDSGLIFRQLSPTGTAMSCRAYKRWGPFGWLCSWFYSFWDICCLAALISFQVICNISVAVEHMPNSDLKNWMAMQLGKGQVRPLPLLDPFGTFRPLTGDSSRRSWRCMFRTSPNCWRRYIMPGRRFKPFTWTIPHPPLPCFTPAPFPRCPKVAIASQDDQVVQLQAHIGHWQKKLEESDRRVNILCHPPFTNP